LAKVTVLTLIRYINTVVLDRPINKTKIAIIHISPNVYKAYINRSTYLSISKTLYKIITFEETLQAR